MNAPRGLTPDVGAGTGRVDDGDAAGTRWQPLWQQLQGWAAALGFSQIAVADVDIGAAAERGLAEWLAQGCHGDMHYMAAHGVRRARPAELRPGTLRVITARMDYLPRAAPARQTPPAAASGPAGGGRRPAAPALAGFAVGANGEPTATRPSASASLDRPSPGPTRTPTVAATVAATAARPPTGAPSNGRVWPTRRRPPSRSMPVAATTTG